MSSSLCPCSHPPVPKTPPGDFPQGVLKVPILSGKTIDAKLCLFRASDVAPTLVLTNVKNGKIKARQYKTLKPTGGLSESKRPTPESAGF